MIRRLIERNSEALMTNILSADLGEGVRANYRLWNEEKRAELTALFEKLGPNGYSIEYVGSPVQDGAQAMDEMWDQYDGVCTTELVTIIVNDNEAAECVRNNMKMCECIVPFPTITTINYIQ